MKDKPENPTRIVIDEGAIALFVARQLLPGYMIKEAWIDAATSTSSLATLNVVSPQLPPGRKVRVTVSSDEADGPHTAFFVSGVDVESEGEPAMAAAGR